MFSLPYRLAIADRQIPSSIRWDHVAGFVTDADQEGRAARQPRLNQAADRGGLAYRQAITQLQADWSTLTSSASNQFDE
jgi:hypothetical protein